jgi:hypothetical protein
MRMLIVTLSAALMLLSIVPQAGAQTFTLTYCKAIFLRSQGNTLTNSRRVAVLPFHLQLAQSAHGVTIRSFRISHPVTLLPDIAHSAFGGKADIGLASLNVR